MPVDDLAFSMINRKGLTLKLELRGYMNISHPGIQISKPGYLKQRMKLNPEAFVDLYQFHNRNFYSDPDAELYTFNGFLVLAVDGSDINIPTTPETIAMFGDASVRGGKPCAQIGLGCLYDALNRMILDASCNRVKFNEMAVAEAQIANVRETICWTSFCSHIVPGVSVHTGISEDDRQWDLFCRTFEIIRLQDGTAVFVLG